MTYSRIHKMVRELDPNLATNDPAFLVAVILLSGLQVGPNIRQVARFTGLTYQFVTEIGRRLRANGVWCGSKIAADWFDKENGGCAFWLDVNVGLGFLKRTAA